VRGTLLASIGGGLLVVGLIWTLQGLGYLTGSPMTDQVVWAVIGPLVGLVGVVLMVRGLRRSGPRSRG
jgi:hypothetical protein